MRTYLINLIDIPSKKADEKFFKKVHEHKLEWWRYFPLSFILLTPDDIYTNTLTSWLVECYGAIFFAVIEIDIKDVGGVCPVYNVKEDITKDNFKNISNPFAWFSHIKDPNFIPRWKREEAKEKNSK